MDQLSRMSIHEIFVNEPQYLDVLSGEIEKNLYKVFIYIIYRFYTDFSLFRQIKRQDIVNEHAIYH